MAAVFGVLCAVAMIWAAVKYFAIRSALLDKLPLQFRDELSSRYAIPIYALEPSTPLPLQADYVTLMAVGSVAMICFALACLLAGQMAGALLAGLGSVAVIASTIKSWWTYRDNCIGRSTAIGPDEV
ncbi:hypothetical protein QCM77_41455 [Bradyrhizobium sp. SSUT18]|uniref:hypothetical protein n=1 Tax=unclassified Bradyrhizobium TaxID=2631580 RepID=UPI00244C3140|nr:MULTISPECIES: hypothetical protein [unclassified Bradyrhizobium]MDH2348489.1 hypothetical protein [Bradyrhizobium sp. SSUT77]MDH2356630.1 hypothetical protein [Bradyrhizobium sp. SSUT112]MDH2406298.1 hypothetical protein [Bradyrhizobium sp. SSUT18]